MKILIYHWNSYLQYDILEICKEKNIGYVQFEWTFQDRNKDDAFLKWFYEEIPMGEYDALLSVNYFPLLSEACTKKNLKYIAWCYDAPLNVRRIEETLHNPVNYVFLFDKAQYLQYVKQGFETVYHLPLGVNATRLKRLKVTKEDIFRYKADVAFVGKLYESPIHELMQPLDDYSKGYLQSLMDVQSKLYGCYLFDDTISEDFVENMNTQYANVVKESGFRLSKPELVFAMAEEITRKDRLVLLNLCGKRFVTKFYSYVKHPLLKNVVECGTVNYISEMPKVFACTKVNLNPSLRIIQSGIPLRAFDIMGAGGFLLSNYQEEFLEYFENEQDMVLYESIEDAVEKAEFYMQHEEIRQKIAENGKRRTLEEHSLQGRFAAICDIVEIS